MYKNVKAEFARKGLTLEIVAKELGVTVSTLSQKMNGKYPFTLNEAKTIKKVLEVDIPLEILFEEVG
jgi:transcriptional regulator with XRE-family HTH domain